MNSVNTYYTILGITGQANVEELKKAYRQKAKQLHPDKNKSANAHQEFILLNEAYEYLLKLKTGGVTPKQASAHYEDWYNHEREKTKARARAYAQMQYTEFIKSGYYKSLTSFSIITDVLYLIFLTGLLIALPIIISINFGTNGFLGILLVLFVTLPLTVIVIKNSPALKFGNFVSSLLYIIQTRWFIIITTTILNIFIFLKIGLQTLLPGWMILTIAGLTILSSYGMMQWGMKHRNKLLHYFNLFWILPILINLFLAVNFAFSSNPVTEQYHFENDLQPTAKGYQESTYIYLKNNKYIEYPGIRMFLDYEQMKYCNTITYTFENGLFGFRVMKDFKFSGTDEAE